jgi:hypothetical protein
LECYCTGVIVRTTIELPALKQQESNTTTVAAQTADQSVRSFSSLLASSKAAAEEKSATHGHAKGGSSQKSTTEEYPDASPDSKGIISCVGIPELPVTVPQLIVKTATPEEGTQISSRLNFPALTNAQQNPLPLSPGAADTTTETASDANEGDCTIPESGVTASAKGAQSSASVLSPGTSDSAGLRKELSMVSANGAAAVQPKSPTAAKSPGGEAASAVSKTPAIEPAIQSAVAETSSQINLNIPVTSMVGSVGNGSLASVALRPSKPGSTKSGVAPPVDPVAAGNKSGGYSASSKGAKTSEAATTANDDAQTVQPSTDNDRLQEDNSAQSVSAAPTQANFASHLAPTPMSPHDAIVQSRPNSIPANSDGNLARTSASATPSVAVVPQPLPTINTARLIQSMGQSEMRLGMRSEEFGNISIHTSTTRDLLSAQISVDNGDLAKVLAVHLPEIRTRLEGQQAGEVRIDMNSQGSQAGTSNGTSNQSQDESRGDNRGTGQTTTGVSSSKALSAQAVKSSEVIFSSNRGINERLDIRI